MIVIAHDGVSVNATGKNPAQFQNTLLNPEFSVLEGFSKYSSNPHSQERRTQRETQWIEFVFWLWGVAVRHCSPAGSYRQFRWCASVLLAAFVA